MQDWKRHQALLHSHSNYKFQSVYTTPELPVFQDMGARQHPQNLADVIILVFAVGVLAGSFLGLWMGAL